MERVERALTALGRPERAAPVLHVAGTNGKGSTCALAAAALQAAGLRTGLYTSPHLVRFNERIQVDGAPVDDRALAQVVAEVRAACPWHEGGAPEERLSYFEVATLAALRHFARQRVDVMVVEVGLGGRLDATNAVRPAVTAVARIGLDHTQWLGDTVALVAREKAGIFKPGVAAVVHAAQPPGVLEVLSDAAARVGAPFEVAPAGWDGPLGLLGPHQRGNAALAAAALRALARTGLPVGEGEVARGFAAARWPGRLERVGGVLLDGAHNPQGAEALAAALAALHPGQPAELVFGVLADKDHRAMLAALAPAARRLHLVTPVTARARAAAEVAALAAGLGLTADVHPGLPEALACARAAAGGRPVVVAGSLYLVGEARALLLGA
ncbi:MAG: bifunctional folylpolyglutamate synthase/dihydrofolate synthase [Anaeromyxobacter sp.]|nr:bifunctional folylpolyglutamate synthase/dihydrofolate synthase [Anaeromyxobacter sp.]